jgi:predicted unusual protein kinase regulating ubiquinone biosynthesis (AarF/ABC1/UbiB family)
MWQGIKFGAIAVKAAALAVGRPEAGKKYLLESIGKMPGLSAKAGQFMAMHLDIDPEKKVNVEPMALDIVKSIINEHAPKLAAEIDSIEDKPITASLGQVHRVLLKDGGECAVKVQYPNIDKDIDGQLSLMLKSASLSPAKKYGLDIDAYQTFLRDRLGKEVDYLAEAQSQQDFVDAYRSVKDKIIIPTVNLELSSPKVLVQEYVESIPLEEMSSASKDDRWAAGFVLMEFMLREVFVHNLVHADTHPGNWGFRKTGTQIQLVLYDFGSYIKLNPAHSAALKELVFNYQNKTTCSPFDIFCFIGFDPEKLANIAHKMPAVAERMVEPLLTPAAWSPEEWDMGGVFDRILGGDAWWFRVAGPPWFLYLMRSMQGLMNGVVKLDVKIPVGRIFNELIEELPLVMLKGFPDCSKYLEGKTYLSSDCANFLKVLVTEDGQEVVSLEMPARSVDELELLLPEDTAAQIEMKHDIGEIKRAAQREGYLPHTLFVAENGDREYRVWLE